MGSKGGGGESFPAPQPIDPQALIQQQAEANRIDVNSPFGSSTFSGPNRNILNITPSANQQQLLDQIEQAGIQSGGLALSQLGQLGGSPFSFDGLPDLPGINDFGEERSRVESAFFDRALGLLDPAFERDRSLLEGRLGARGIPVGSETERLSFQPLLENRQRGLNQAAQDAILAGGQEQSRLFGQALQGRQQLGQEALTERQQPLAEIAALLGQQGFQNPTSFGPTPVDVLGANQLASNQGLSLYGLGQQSNLASNANQTALLNALIGTAGNVGAFAAGGGFKG